MLAFNRERVACFLGGALFVFTIAFTGMQYRCASSAHGGRGSSLLHLSEPAVPSVLILIAGYGAPTFLSLQIRALRHFLAEPFEVRVFLSRGGSDQDREAWSKACRTWGVELSVIPEHDEPTYPGLNSGWNSARLGAAINWAWDRFALPWQTRPLATTRPEGGYGYGSGSYVMILDTDMFPVKPFSVVDQLAGGRGSRGHDFAIAAVSQSRGPITYLYNGIMFFDLARMTNASHFRMDAGVVGGHDTDTGGASAYYLQANPTVRWRPLTHMLLGWTPESLRPFRVVLGDALIEYFTADYAVVKDWSGAFLDGFVFLHFRGGSNWQGATPEQVQRRLSALQQLIDRVVPGTGTGTTSVPEKTTSASASASDSASDSASGSAASASAVVIK